MRFVPSLIPATLARRHSPFRADVAFESGDMTTVFVANPAAMTGLDRPFSRVWLSDFGKVLRKAPLTWELVEADFGNGRELVGVNMSRPNRVVADALAAGLIPELADYPRTRRDMKYGKSARADFLLEDPKRPPCYVEVKNVHLMRTPRLAEFPDCVTARGARHLDELAAVTAEGARAAIVFVIQVPSAERFAIAGDIDPDYAAAFRRARRKGVQMLAWRCKVNVDGIAISAPVPIVDD